MNRFRAKRGDELDALLRRGGVLRALGEMIDRCYGLAAAIETLALEVDAERNGDDSILAARERADAELRQTDQ